jgi:hypothetical protein
MSRNLRYPFWLIDGKLRESDFFLEKLRAAPDLDSARYYFSAFLSATRSVTFALQKCLTGLSSFDDWYEQRRKELKIHPMAAYFKDIRNQVIHEGLNPLGLQTRRMGISNFYLVEGAPERDVVVAGHSYMAALVSMASMAYQRFWTGLDLPSALTLGDLTARGQTVEDLEEEFGCPRGRSEGIDRSDEERFRLIKEFSKTSIGELAERYHSGVQPSPGKSTVGNCPPQDPP